MLSSGMCHKHPHNDCDNYVVFNYEGPVAGDGCDWVVTANGQRFHPAQLDDSMKQDSLVARANYTLTGDTFYCGLLPMGLPVIELTCFQYLEE